mmetsp:Transcript_63353/g.92843  ORF Transcript_63353/g.92843 Transcript_63353/m.92843 type:complete len:186 (-) Transcript_63353:1741-2298(-)
MKINITQNTQEGHLGSRTHNVCVFCTRPSWIRLAFVFLTRSKNHSHTLSRKKLHNELLSCQCSLALLMERMTLHSHTYIYLHTHTCACRHRIGVCVCVYDVFQTPRCNLTQHTPIHTISPVFHGGNNKQACALRSASGPPHLTCLHTMVCIVANRVAQQMGRESSASPFTSEVSTFLCLCACVCV